MATEDITELSTDIQHALFEQASDAIFVMDAQDHLIAVNQTACDYLGYNRQELLGLTPAQISAPEFVSFIPERMECIRTTGNCTFESVHLRRDGGRVPVEIHSRIVAHEGHDYILTICRDISLRKKNEIEYRSIIQAAGDGYWAVRASDARIVDVNDTFCRMVGYTRSELLSMSIFDLEASESPDETASHIRKIIDTGHDLFETRHRHKDGHVIEFEISVSYATVNGGTLFVFTRDIGIRKQQEAEARLAALIFNASTTSIMATDAENRIVSVNPAFTRITGYELHEVIGKDPRLLQSGRQDSEFYRQMWQALNEKGQWEGEWWNRRKDGEEYAEQVAMNVVRNTDGRVYRYVKISADITEKKRLDDIIWRQAHYDTLTSLPNRRMFYSLLAGEIRNCKEAGLSLAMYFIDLDGFKEVNDNYGHDAGDRLLAETARRIEHQVRSTDTVARLGGDEFTVILSGLSDLSRVDSVGQQLLAALTQPFALGAETVRISASIGVALYPLDAHSSDSLVKQADQAMYHAKNSGKNALCHAADNAR